MPRKKVINSVIPEAPLASIQRKILLFLAIIATFVLVYLGSIFVTSPEPIRNPAFEHYHFRMQIMVDGKAVDFGDEKFQAKAVASGCNVELTSRPIHFHDNIDQFVHIHWAKMTGGLVLKNYGWNFIGGSDGYLGYRFDNLFSIKSVPTHGRDLPVFERGSNYFVYTGDKTSFVERDFEQFKSQDLEKFFGKKSNLGTASQDGILSWLMPKAYAHGGEAHSEADGQKSREEINNLIGNVVIFVQKDRPSYEQVKSRFNNLEPLSDTTCAG